MTYQKKPTIDTPAYNGRAIIHFHPGKHYYTVSVPELNREKVYQPGVTTVLGIKDKSGPLCWWTAEQCELYGLSKVEELQKQVAANAASPDQVQPLSVLSVDFVLRTLGEMKHQYRYAKKQAADIGSLVHDFAHQYLEYVHFGAVQPSRPRFDPMNPLWSVEMIEKANAAIDAALRFFREHELKPLSMERPVWSATHGVIGTDDFKGYVDGELCIIDYKTGKRLYPEVWLQTAMYQCAAQEEKPRPMIRARWGVNICKDGSLEAIRRGNEFYEADLKGFLALRDAYLWDRAHGYEPKEAIEIIGALPEKSREKRLAISKV
jgi:hypothetical protein